MAVTGIIVRLFKEGVEDSQRTYYLLPNGDAYVSRSVSKTMLKRIFKECTAAVKAAKGE